MLTIKNYFLSGINRLSLTVKMFYVSCELRITYILTESWFRRLVADLSPRRHGFEPELILMNYHVAKKATLLEQVFLRVLSFHPPMNTLKMLQTKLHIQEKVQKRKPIGKRVGMGGIGEKITVIMSLQKVNKNKM
jgi:hypothetical protein